MKKVDLKTIPTRQLLQWLDTARVNGYWIYEYGYEDVIYDDIKEELATREHVPNKIEARAIRQAKAKAKRNR